MTSQHSAGAGPLTAQHVQAAISRCTAPDTGRIDWASVADALNARLAAAPTGQADASEEQTEAQADLLAYLMSTPPPSWDYDEVMKMVKAATGQEAEHALQSMDASLRKLEKAVGVAPVPQDLARLEARLDEHNRFFAVRHADRIAQLEAELTLLRAQQAKETK